MALKPLHDRVLVKRTESEEKTAGGLIIPDSAKEKPSEGEVVAVGTGARKDNGELIAPAVKAGDKVQKMNRAADRVGVIYLKFNSDEEMQEKMNNMEKYLKVILEKDTL